MIASADGCKAGWLVAVGETWPCKRPPCLLICRDFQAVLTATRSCDVVVVDMPIGLPSGAERRDCDQLARRALGPEAQSRVFYAPPRRTLEARTPEEFQAVHKELTGRGAGYPLWPMLGKLRDVDAVMTPALQQRVFEFHPELAWQRLAGGGAALQSKHTGTGLGRRQDLLREAIHGADTLITWKSQTGKAIEVVDVLDALVGLSVAHNLATDRKLYRLPDQEEPPKDENGLRMEIWF